MGLNEKSKARSTTVNDLLPWPGFDFENWALVKLPTNWAQWKKFLERGKKINDFKCVVVCYYISLAQQISILDLFRFISHLVWLFCLFKVTHYTMMVMIELLVFCSQSAQKNYLIHHIHFGLVLLKVCNLRNVAIFNMPNHGYVALDFGGEWMLLYTRLQRFWFRTRKAWKK